MNYRHSYHAGNYADVLKHAVLAQITEIKTMFGIGEHYLEGLVEV